MNTFVILWLIVALYQVFEVARAVRALLVRGGTVTFHWSFLLLAGANALLGGLYMAGVVR